MVYLQQCGVSCNMMRHDPPIPLSEVVDIRVGPHVSSNIERDSLKDTSRYIPDTSALKAIDVFTAGLRTGTALSIVGPYGSGKSTFGVILGQLAAPHNEQGWKSAYRMLQDTSPDAAATLAAGKRRAGLHGHGMIRCMATARLEPVAATILRAAAYGAESWFGVRYGRRHFAEAATLRRCTKSLRMGVVPDAAVVSRIISSMAAAAPVLLVIDEFGKNIEYFASGGSDGDLFLLQDLAEMSGGSRGVRLHIVTMQHMAFVEYVSDTPAARAKEWAKIQGRFETVHFSNSLEHTRALLSSSLNGMASSRIMEWATHHSKDTSKEAGVDISPELAASCYPLHPLAVEALPELCARYGQNDRTLLSFVSGNGPGTITRFIECTKWDRRDLLPVMGVDQLYDYFISGSAPSRVGAASQSSRLIEIDTIIRDDRTSDYTEQRVLKTIGLLNLIGRSGRLRASMGMIRCLVGAGAEQAVQRLEARSAITYRWHADEYRIWHGTDVNIAAKLDVWRKAMLARPHAALMQAAMEPDPVVAAKYGIETGTMRVFRCLFEGGHHIEREYDGVIILGTENTPIPESKKPVLVARCHDTDALAGAAAEVAALHAVLREDDVAGDWVARAEVAERLAAAKNVLDGEFERAYGVDTIWSYRMCGKVHTVTGTASSAASAASYTAYHKSPAIRNEMINRNRLTAQGSTALNRLMHLMLTAQNVERLGMDGWRPERAIYEAVISEYDIHKRDGGTYRFGRPAKGLRAAWNAALHHMQVKRRVSLVDIYDIWRMPPYGIKDGIMPVLALLVVLVRRKNVAIYEHGTYVYRLNASLAERMVKNPQHFTLKYYTDTKSRSALVEKTAKSLGTDVEHDMLGIVQHLVGVVRALPTYTRRTHNLSKRTLAVRDIIQNAIEPDMLLFEDLPWALGVVRPDTDRRAALFADRLRVAVEELRGAFETIMGEMRAGLLRETDMDGRESLAGTASKLVSYVTDQKMKVFLGAVSADIPDDTAWITYVGLALTDVPPTDWSDEHHTMFWNGLREAASGFKRLAALRFGDISESFGQSVMVTITRPDGSEIRMVLPADDERVASLSP